MDILDEVQQASQSGTVDDVVNLINIFGFLMKLLIPLFAVLLIVYMVRSINRKKKLREKQNKNKKQQQKQVNKELDKTRRQNMIKNNRADEIFSSDENLMALLKDADEPIVKSKYKNLDLEFGEDGKVIH